jgi:hypothetical protein
MPGSINEIFDGSSATQDLESIEGPDMTMISGKTRDSGYGSMNGTGEPGDL